MTDTYGQSLYEIKIASFSNPLVDDYAPFYFKDGVLFTSNRKRIKVLTYETPDGLPTSNLYFVRQKDSVTWGDVRLLNKSLATLYNEGAACFDSVHNILYFTQNLFTAKKDRNQENNYGIFAADLEDGNWTNIRPLSFNDPTFKTGHPALTTTGDTLFFASDRPGGRGGADLYMSVKRNDTWLAPENLGPVVNSDSSELFPFWHPSGRLYFSSNRRGSMGGLDLYYTRLVDGKWLPVVHLQPPFNSTSDDFGFIAGPAFSSGMFTSSRNGHDNIFTFTSLVPENPGCKTMEPVVNCFLFYETESHGIDTIPVIYQWDFGDGKQTYGHTAEHCYDDPGTYLARLNVTDTITGEVRHDVATYLVEVVKVEQAIIEAPDSCFTGERVSFKGGVEISGFTPARYLWNFGDGEIMEGPEVNKTYYDPGTYSIQLSVFSVPDDQENIRQTCVTKDVKVILKQ